MEIFTVDMSWSQVVAVPLITGAIVFFVGFLLFSAKHPAAHLIGAFVIAIGSFVALGAFPIIDKPIALLVALIALAIMLFKVEKKTSFVFWAIAIVCAILAIIAIIALLGTFSPNTPIGQAYALILEAFNAIWGTVFHS